MTEPGRRRAGEATARFVLNWALLGVVKPTLQPLMVLDIHGILTDDDKVYFRKQREERFGAKLEEARRARASRVLPAPRRTCFCMLTTVLLCMQCCCASCSGPPAGSACGQGHARLSLGMTHEARAQGRAAAGRADARAPPAQLCPAGQTEAKLDAFRASLEPLRATLGTQPFLGGEKPLYADIIMFSFFMMTKGVSPKALLKADDPVFAWRERMLDAYGGEGRKAVGFPVKAA